MTNTLDSNTAKAQAFLAVFAWDIQVARYTSYSSALTISSISYTSVPEMEIDFDGFLARPEPDRLTIKIPKTYSPADTLSTGRPHAMVRCHVYEVNPEDTTSMRLLMQGVVTGITNDSNGTSGITEITIQDDLVFTDMALGIGCGTTCVWSFGDENDSPCGIALAPLKVSAGITSISGLVLETSATPATADYYLRGRVEKDGVRINIRKAVDGTLTLVQYPPSSWEVGNTITLVPGCDKQLTTCRTKWDNESQFCGLGLNMPNYNPIFEGGS
jgi:hypothetical protein